jgi:hypothetical protein
MNSAKCCPFTAIYTKRKFLTKRNIPLECFLTLKQFASHIIIMSKGCVLMKGIEGVLSSGPQTPDWYEALEIAFSAKIELMCNTMSSRGFRFGPV